MKEYMYMKLVLSFQPSRLPVGLFSLECIVSSTKEVTNIIYNICYKIIEKSGTCTTLVHVVTCKGIVKYYVYNKERTSI